MEKKRYELTVAAEGGDVTCVICEPDIKVMAAVTRCAEVDGSGKFAGFDTVKAGLILLDSCKESGDASFETDDKVRYAAAMRCMELFQSYDATLKKL